MSLPQAISHAELQDVIAEFASRLYTVEGRLNLQIDRLQSRMGGLENLVKQLIDMITTLMKHMKSTL